MANHITRSKFENLMERNLTAVFIAAKKAMATVAKNEIYDQRSSSQKEEKIQEFVGFGGAPKINEGSGPIFDTSRQTWVYPFEMEKFGLGFSVTQELVDDNQYQSLTPQWTKMLARSMADTEEILGAEPFNLGHSSYLLPDGKSLFADDHPRFGASDFSNVLESGVTTDFSEDSIEQMRIKVDGWTDERELDTSIDVDTLVLPRQLVYNATRVLKSDLRSGTAENDINAMKYMGQMLKVVKLKKLVNPNRFFLITNEPQGFIWYNRKKWMIKKHGDFYTDTLQFKGSMRFKAGVASKYCAISNG